MYRGTFGASGARDSATEPTLLRILVYLVMYDSGYVSLGHRLISRHPCRPTLRLSTFMSNITCVSS